MKADLQINIDGTWLPIVTYDRISPGGWLEYEPDYVINQKDSPHNRAGLLYPVNFQMYECSKLPAFLVDIMPSGAGRRVWVRRLGRSDDGSENLDWDLLLAGSGNPPGNLRVHQAVIEPPEQPHPGFTMEDIVSKKSDFIEYAEERGAMVAGATDIPGDAPKFMVARDQAGKWHPDGALPAEKVVDSWIVKFPRGKTDEDKLVLRNEAPYYEVARWFGVHTGAKLIYRDNCLFIPRFDREPVGGKLLCHGMETACSVAGIPEYGKRGNHYVFCHAIAKVVADPMAELQEYLKRDILNAALRNVDNHGRNTAVIKKRGLPIGLSPLFDFAPMSLDPDGIARASLWNGSEPSIGRPDWVAVAKGLGDLMDVARTIEFLASQAPIVAQLPAIMKQLGVETKVLEEVGQRCEEIAKDLEKTGGQL